MSQVHSFHIPVMGIGYTVETPLKVSKYGIDSVISLVDDLILEKLRKMYCEKFELPYNEISDKIEDFRAKRITSYLNVVNTLAKKKFEELKDSAVEKSQEIKEYFNLLPDNSELKKEFQNIAKNNSNKLGAWVKQNLSMGSIDVNIMTKLDKVNYKKGEQLPPEYNDAHAALRGYANSDLCSSIVLSAGMSPRLYSYLEQFDDFFPDEKGRIKKKVILKVSDYRSALIQGKFFAKKGIWVSEYRVESGLNCGGHLFATDGFLLGPILAEFKDKRSQLTDEVTAIYKQALEAKGKVIADGEMKIAVTAQGGVGTAEEHNFLINHYEVDAVGWGTPFLLVPEATTVDDATLQQLADSREEDLYMSYISPVGVPFSNLRISSKETQKLELAKQGKPGSACPKKYLVNNTEYTEKVICTASRQYQNIKLKELDEMELDKETYQKKYNKIIEKACICTGLVASTLAANNLNTRIEGTGVSICPSQNLAFFTKIASMKEMVDHIYGRADIIRKDRSHFLIKELDIYIEYLKGKFDEAKESMNKKQTKYFATFVKNMNEGVNYYHSLFSDIKDFFVDTKPAILKDLEKSKKDLSVLHAEIEKAIS